MTCGCKGIRTPITPSNQWISALIELVGVSTISARYSTGKLSGLSTSSFNSFPCVITVAIMPANVFGDPNGPLPTLFSESWTANSAFETQRSYWLPTLLRDAPEYSSYIWVIGASGGVGLTGGLAKVTYVQGT